MEEEKSQEIAKEKEALKESIINELKKGMLLVLGDTEICVRLRIYDKYLPITTELIDMKIGGRKVKNWNLEHLRDAVAFFQKVANMLEIVVEKEEE
ncbi:MAG: hypothetical protein QW734_06490 [Candidatus Bathyarchaeia archaeon]